MNHPLIAQALLALGCWIVALVAIVAVWCAVRAGLVITRHALEATRKTLKSQ
jgi:uncharacterized membrane protein